MPSLAGQAVERPGVDHDAVAGVGRVQRLAVPVGRGDDHGYRQVVLPGEVEVACVVAGHGHDRAGAVAHQHVVGDVDGHVGAVHRD